VINFALVARNELKDGSLTGAACFERDQNDTNPLVISYLIQADFTLFLGHAPVVLGKSRLVSDVTGG
jgi:hypothetical protein